mmetsp:Transcript_29316/g.64221  ORF Transcript_29316/g.64221 Transcript_29316/m.64221 type:complete len:107 (-) Transcript_29316:810-1130(-)
MRTQSQCEASYVRAGNPWIFTNGIQGRNFRRCIWSQGRCSMGDGFNCRNPDSELQCIDVWYNILTTGQTCSSLAIARARSQGISVQSAAVQIGNEDPNCAPCANAA